MHSYSIKLHRFLLCQLLLTVVGSGPVFAQVSTGVMEHVPVGSIQSINMADQALHEAKQKRLVANQQFMQEEYACYEKFFANSCIQGAKERLRVTLRKIRTVEIDANAFKRRVRIEERDQEVAEKSTQRQHEPSERSDDLTRDENSLFEK